MGKLSSAGNSGPKVRSDCEVLLELKNSGGISIELKSKVKALYGDSIESQVKELLGYFGVKHCSISVTDAGALPFVIAARVEAAVKKLKKDIPEFLPEFNKENRYDTEKDRFRFSRLYLPGNNPSLMINAGLHSADGIILDLEDSVSPDKKDEARLIVRNALRTLSFNGAERMVRINQGERGIEDLRFLIAHNVNLILIPKCETAEEVLKVEKEIVSLRKLHKIRTSTWLMPIIESALGTENAFEIAKCSPSVVAMAIGLEDYTADLGVQRTLEGKESLYARTRIINAAKAARIQPIDSVFSDVADMEGLLQNVQNSKALGFEGMGCIHPRQIAVIKKGFSPTEEETEKAKKICLAYEDAASKGLGVVALGSKMIDPPVVERARKTIGLAEKLGLLSKDWRKETNGEI